MADKQRSQHTNTSTTTAAAASEKQNSAAANRKHSPGMNSLSQGARGTGGRKVSPTTPSAAVALQPQNTGNKSPQQLAINTNSVVLRRVRKDSYDEVAPEKQSAGGKRSVGAVEALHKFAQDLCSGTNSRRSKFHKFSLGEERRKWSSLDGAERTERPSKSLPVSGRPSSQLSVQQQQLLLHDLSPEPSSRISPIPEDGAPFWQPGFVEMLNMAATNPDLVQFQLVLNDWLRRQCRLRTSAFMLSSAELNVTHCQVCGSELPEEPIHCGDADYLESLLCGCESAAGCSAARVAESESGDEGTAQNETPAPLVARLEELPEHLLDPLRPVLARLLPPSGADPCSSCVPPISLVAILANCRFRALLLAVHQSEESRHEELQVLRPHLGMLGTLLSILHNLEEQRRLAHQSQVFLCMTQNVFSSLQDMNQLVRNITKEAKSLVQAEICSLFLLDKEHSELVAEVFEKNGTTDEYLTEIRMPLTQGIVGHVATTGQMMNVRDVYNHPYFYPKVDERTGFVTRNILCFPIKDSSGNLVGVAELCNKIGRDAFTRHDEQIAATFAVYCAISISHCLLYRKLQEAHRRSHMAAELLVQGSTLSIAPEDILRLTVRDIPSPESFHPEFTRFHFVPRSIGAGDIYVEASLSMFKDLGFIDRFRLRRRTLARFLLMVQKGYRDVPYHNWGHAFAVGHFCYLLLRMPAVRAALNELERFALLVACLCHDIDHRGTTNAFQLQSKTPLAQLYSSEGSVLERHHFAQTVSILGMDECNIFEQLSRQQYQTVLDCIREVILATDIAAHLRKVDRIREMTEEGFDSRSSEHRYLFMCLLMTSSDLSDQSKDFRHSKAIAENIYKEFFSQGDLEKQMGNRPIEMMDRERACVPKIQLEFMDGVALPVFKFLGDLLPDLQSTHKALLVNRRCWLMLDNILQEQGLPSGGLDYLRDATLEEKVLQRVRADGAKKADEGTAKHLSGTEWRQEAVEGGRKKHSLEQ